MRFLKNYNISPDKKKSTIIEDILVINNSVYDEFESMRFITSIDNKSILMLKNDKYNIGSFDYEYYSNMLINCNYVITDKYNNVIKFTPLYEQSHISDLVGTVPRNIKSAESSYIIYNNIFSIYDIEDYTFIRWNNHHIEFFTSQNIMIIDNYICIDVFNIIDMLKFLFECGIINNQKNFKMFLNMLINSPL